MLRISVLLSISLHVLLLSLVSVVVVSFARQTPIVEKRFDVQLRQEPAVRIAETSPTRRAEGLKPTERALAQTPPLPPVLSRLPTSREDISAAIPSAPQMTTQPIRKEPIRQQMQPETLSPLNDPVVAAKPLPTPIPTAKPKPAAKPVKTPLPKHTPQPPAIVTPAVMTPEITRAPQPLPPTPITEQAVRPSESLATTTNLQSTANSARIPSIGSSEATGMRATPSAEEQQAAQPVVAFVEEQVLARYVQDLSAKIQAAIKYPAQARRRGWTGNVALKLRMLPTGTVEKAEIAEPSPYDLLNEAALQAVANAQPFPEFPEGLARQSITLNVPIQFRLERR